MPPPARPRPRRAPIAGALALLGLLAACGPAPMPPGDIIADRSETRNRAVHAFNLALDRSLVGPASDGYGSAVPEPVRRGVGNFAANLNQPGYVLNDLLQFRLADAAQNTLRFAINTTVGLGGLLDPATAMGLPALDTDFGETLYVYGAQEGDYIVLPVLGPSTTRDAVGRVVDTLANPLRHLVEPPHDTYLGGARVVARFGDRYDFAGTVDDILYGSEDSYLQMRSLYLQSRRYALRGDDPDAYLDPYAEAAADPTADPYYDPYADPYYDPYAP